MPRYERFVNRIQTTLDGAITDSATTVTVSDANGSGYPLLGDFRILVESEVMHVTALSGNDLTVVRGVDGTSAASHSDGVVINPIITQEGFDAFLDHIQVGSSNRPQSRWEDIDGNVLTSTDFSLDNAVSNHFLTDGDDGSIILASDNTATTTAHLHVSYKDAPATTPWTLTACVIIGLGWDWAGGSNSTTGGICVRESDTGELINLSAGAGSPSANQDYLAFHWNSPTSSNAAIPSSISPECNTNWCWMQIEDNGTNLFWRVSHNGIRWHEIASDGRTDLLSSAGPDQIGLTMAIRANGSTSPRHEIICKTWLEE